MRFEKLGYYWKTLFGEGQSPLQLETENRTILRERAGMSRKIFLMEGVIGNFVDTLRDSEEEMAQLQKERDALEGENIELQRKNRSAARDIEALRDDKFQLLEKIRQARRDAEASERNARTLRNEIEELYLGRVELNKRVETAEKDKEDFQRKLRELRERTGIHLLDQLPASQRTEILRFLPYAVPERTARFPTYERNGSERFNELLEAVKTTGYVTNIAYRPDHSDDYRVKLVQDGGTYCVVFVYREGSTRHKVILDTTAKNQMQAEITRSFIESLTKAPRL